MVSTSKILTVSYGTFSCTLEGFDDSFDTMKAIAEYFRDLASDDRYFGAEPPTPDAEMLARIAEREVARRVEAHDENGQIVLRTGAASALTDAAADAAHSAVSSARDTAEASSDTEEAETAEAEAASHTATPTVDVAQPESDDTDDDAFTSDDGAYSEDAYADVETITPAPAPAPESVADKLRRIRAVASPASPAFDNSYSEDEHADTDARDFLGNTAADLDAILEVDDANEPDAAAQPDAGSYENVEAYEDEDEEDILAHLIDEKADESDADDLTAISPDAETAPDAAAPLADTADSDDQDADEEPDAVADTASTADADDQAMLDALLAGDEDEIAQEDAAQTEVLADENGQNSDESEPSESYLASEESRADESSESLADRENLNENDDDDDDVAFEDDDTPGDGVEIELAAEDTLAQLMADALRDEAPATTDDAGNAIAENAPAKPPLAARVIKVKRREIDDAIADGTLEETSDSDVDTSRSDPSPLSDEDEAELQRELAEVEAELQQTRRPAAQQRVPDEVSFPQETTVEDTADAVIESAKAQSEASHEARDTDAKRGKRLEPMAADDQAPRIFDEAATQLEEPESNERRNAIQHLRAAVAATKAERSAGGAMQEDVDDEPYRLDLKSAVRPRRPQAVSGTGERSARSERPRSTRPAPLKLVAEQRIDAPSSEPVRPRRVSRSDLAAAPRQETPASEAPQPTASNPPAPQRTTEAGNFIDFAEDMGARSLPDLLEAAAAYMSDVEGHSEFSRPMLMHKLKEASPADFSREEGLRSFGKLLRDGKLQKLKGGRFAVTDATDFRPRTRAAG
ncbi:hypothetical protein G5B38_03345 [Pseudohalocynthiibacter aestuariivivens]|nr:hypothetical protein [Pseudohalocynthiibacter aestuariivivens]QIE44643.1 hypothetical protein G5B38_03345 [Pseudohalocynthiibacter aestuariivivens]